LHTDTNCKVDGLGQSNPQAGRDCALDTAGSAGCDVNEVRTNSFGPGFNANHGGHYVMEWDSDAIKTWFFPRGQSLPPSLTSENPDTSEFGIPAANFKGDCNIDQRFKDQRFICTSIQRPSLRMCTNKFQSRTTSVVTGPVTPTPLQAVPCKRMT
jgi:hypothetical protein